MFQCLSEVKQKLREMSTRLLKDMPGIRIGMIAHGDYCDEKIYYLLKKLDFTTKVADIEQFVSDDNITGTGGGDPEEAYEYALNQAQTFTWTPNYKRALVIIGDDVPHTKEKSAKKLDWRAETNKLVKMGVKIYSIQCLDRDYATNFYKELADLSGGAHFKLDEFAAITEMFMGLCYREGAEFQLEALHKEITAEEKEIPDGEGPRVMLPENMLRADLEFTDEDLLTIHRAIHSPIHTSKEKVNVHEQDYTVAIGRAGCRFVSIGDFTFIEQNKNNESKYAVMALEGKKITWILKNGKWGVIIDDIVNPST